MNKTTLANVSSLIADSQHILITAGAGMSAAAGFDYGENERYKELFPAFARKGFTARYQAIGYRGWTPAEFWAYWAIHVEDIRFGERNDATYRQLLALTEHADTFVYTSNVDQLFARNGFSGDKLYTPQGDYGYLQCAKACQDVVWDSEPIIKTLLKNMDPTTQTITNPDVIPHCPNCGGEVFLNVRIDQYFVESPYREELARFSAWIEKIVEQPFLIIEIGAGFNTPSVIRWPGERLVQGTRQGKLLRINKDYPQVPDAISNRAQGINENAAEVINQLYEYRQMNKTVLS